MPVSFAACRPTFERIALAIEVLLDRRHRAYPNSTLATVPQVVDVRAKRNAFVGPICGTPAPSVYRPACRQCAAVPVPRKWNAPRPDPREASFPRKAGSAGSSLVSVRCARLDESGATRAMAMAPPSDPDADGAPASRRSSVSVGDHGACGLLGRTGSARRRLV